MKKLKTILQSNKTYYSLIIISIIYIVIFTKIINYKSIYNETDNRFICILKDFNIDGDELKLELKCEEKLIGYYTFDSIKDKNSFNVPIGAKLQIEGVLEKPKKNTIPNTFNNKKYLYDNRIYYILRIKNIKTINNNISIFNKIKNNIINRINTINNNKYLKAFILGNKKDIEENTYVSYQYNGVSHLFALSGLHVSIFSILLMFVLKKIYVIDIIRYIIIFIFLLLFSFISGFNPSILRASILFFLIGINKVFSLKIRTINLLYLTFFILIIIEPFNIYKISFILSFVTTYSIIKYSQKEKNYIKSIIKTSIICFFATIGFNIYYFGYITPLSIIFNLVFIPIITFIVFPVSIIIVLIPRLSSLFNFIFIIMEKISIYLNKFALIMYFPKISIYEIIIYYLILFLTLYKKKNAILIIIFLLIIYVKPYFNKKMQIYYLDVGQADCSLIITPYKKEVIMIDTSGKYDYYKENWRIKNKEYNIIIKKIIPFLRSKGVNKIDYLILTHGDNDHIGEAINLIKNFRINRVIFNNDEYNELEKNLIKLLKKMNINYYKNIDKIDNEHIKLLFLNTKNYTNENDNSNVIYFSHNHKKFLFMGDAGIEKERDLMGKYNITDIDFLKVGHHGSDTSTSKEFISMTKPKECIISVGKNNIYKHPKQSVIDTLNDCNIFRTDINGTIEVYITKNIFKIETNNPY